MPHGDSDAQSDLIRAAIPNDGLFHDREWLISPNPFPLGPELADQIARLGPALLAFLRACNSLYLDSARGHAPAWVADLLDLGKPPELIAISRAHALKVALPAVIRPDLILTEDGFAISEIDSVPGGIGATAWMNQTYAALGHDVVGGPAGIQRSFAGLLQGGTVVFSTESADYLPEMRWLASSVRTLFPESAFSVTMDSDFARLPIQSGQTIYRFFELFDLANVAGSSPILAASADGRITLTAPPKPFLEEKLWLALFWSPALRSRWADELGDDDAFLRRHIPYGWVIDPTPLPYFAEFPRLGIQDWIQLADFGKADRQLVLKISGFSERAWGSRGVFLGHDLPRDDWADAIRAAIASFPTNPYILQDFHKARAVRHPVSPNKHRPAAEFTGRVRLCPYYFAPPGATSTTLSGIMATIAPADKKIIHGMRDAALVPCTV